MGRARYYDELCELAQYKRSTYSVDSSRFGLREVRGIFRKEGIIIDKRKLPSSVKAIYMRDNDDISVAIQASLPMEPRLFALVHELKHHWADQEIIANGEYQCGDYNGNELIEKGAEVCPSSNKLGLLAA